MHRRFQFLFFSNFKFLKSLYRIGHGHVAYFVFLYLCIDFFCTLVFLFVEVKFSVKAKPGPPSFSSMKRSGQIAYFVFSIFVLLYFCTVVFVFLFFSSIFVFVYFCIFYLCLQKWTLP